MKLGLLGGTFDPPHWGHLWLAELARIELKLDKVLFLPVGQPPHKPDRPITAVAHRLQMVTLAIQDNPHFLLDKTDCQRTPPHHTVTLLPLLQKRWGPARFWFLLGGDSLQDLPTWAQPAELISHCRLGVLPRPGVRINWLDLETAVPHIKTAIDILDGPTLSLSASTVRNWMAAGKRPTYLLPAAVCSYIQEHRLYRADGR